MALSSSRQLNLCSFGKISKSKASLTGDNKRKRQDDLGSCSKKVRLSEPVQDQSIGTQAFRLKAKAAAIKSEIVERSESQPPAQSLDNSQPPKAIKARTLSLFDRVRNKQNANSSLAKPTAEMILRRHAIGRLPDVVDILRMKQQQRMSATFKPLVHTSPSKAKAKVCLSLGQAVNEIKGSLAVPISQEEIKMCIEILSSEIPGTWLTKFTLGKVESVVLNGIGLSGTAVKRILEEQQ